MLQAKDSKNEQISDPADFSEAKQAKSDLLVIDSACNSMKSNIIY